MIQPNLIDEIPTAIPWYRGETVLSLSFDQDKILKDIMRLYNDGQAFDLDATYSTGVMWRKLPKPRLKYDIDPQSPDVLAYSADALPLGYMSVGSIMFDPPFKASNSKVKGIIERRFTAFRSFEALWAFYHSALDEFWRVLRSNGLLVVKCQDGVSSGKNHFSHYEIESYARSIGFEQIDLFVLGRKQVIWSPNMRNQRHARKNHSFFIVLRKPTVKELLNHD